MSSPDADTLIAIKELITDPLLREVRSAIDAGHVEQARQIGTITAGLKRHDDELDALRADVASLKAFKRRVAAVYAVIGLVAGSVCGMLGEWIRSEFFTRAKP